jgi:hypothetical protein
MSTFQISFEISINAKIELSSLFSDIAPKRTTVEEVFEESKVKIENTPLASSKITEIVSIEEVFESPRTGIKRTFSEMSLSTPLVLNVLSRDEFELLLQTFFNLNSDIRFEERMEDDPSDIQERCSKRFKTEMEEVMCM